MIRELLSEAELDLLGMRNTQAIEAHLAVVRRRGYAVTLSPRPLKVLGLAVPVRQGRQVLASLVIRFPRSVMTAEQAADRPLNRSIQPRALL